MTEALLGLGCGHRRSEGAEEDSSHDRLDVQQKAVELSAVWTLALPRPRSRLGITRITRVPLFGVLGDSIREPQPLTKKERRADCGS